MSSMLKFDSERRELVRERRNARIERKLERRQARERKHSQTAEVPSASSATQVLAEREVRSAVDRIVIDALDRHERIAPPATPPVASTRLPDTPAPELARTTTLPPAGGGERAPRRSRRERDLAAFRERRRQTLEEARGEARGRIARAGEPASIADALAALEHPEAAPWSAERKRARSASSSRRRSRPGGSPRSAPPPAEPCGRSAATPRGRLPAGPGATRISRWRPAWRTRSSRGCRAPAQKRPARTPDLAIAIGSPARVLALRARGELRSRAAVEGRARADALRAPRRRFGRPTPREEVS